MPYKLSVRCIFGGVKLFLKSTYKENITLFEEETKRTKKIHNRLIQDYNYVKDLGYHVFGIFLQGSQNYLLDYEDSDIDTKCIVLPSVEEVILNKKPVSTTIVLEDNSHIDIKDIRLMWNCFKKQNINYLEILFTEFYYIPSEYMEYWEKMQNIREEIAHIDNYAAVNCIVGMVLEKNKALCHPYPTLKDKIERYGYDNKQLHHIIRCSEFLDRYIEGTSFEECLIPIDRDFLIGIKATYKYNLDQAKTLAADTVDYVKAIKQAYLNSNERKINEEVCTKLDTILVQTLYSAWVF